MQQYNPQAMFYGQPLTIEQVLASKKVADPLHVLEIVMPVAGGAAMIIASKEVAARARKRPSFITGFGEHLAFKSPSYAQDMVHTPIGPASQRAFNMAGLKPRTWTPRANLRLHHHRAVDPRRCRFLRQGRGMNFVRRHDLTWRGDFPMNTHGGQLSFRSGRVGGRHGASRR